MNANRIPIVGFEGVYEVDCSGNIYSITRTIKTNRSSCLYKGQQIKPIKHQTGYLVFRLTYNGQAKTYRAHRVIAQALVPNLLNLPHVNHIDGNKHNNHPTNLEWCNPQQNMDHARKNGLTASGTRNSGSKLSDHQIKSAFDECVSGALVQDVANRLGVGRNCLPLAFKRLGLSERWSVIARERKSTASLIRHHGKQVLAPLGTSCHK